MTEEIFGNKVTVTGQNVYANALVNGATVALSEIALGDSNGTYYTPTGAETSLVNEVHRINVTDVYNDPLNPEVVVVKGEITNEIGGFTIRETAVYDDAGNMITIGKYPATEIPLPTQGAVSSTVIKLVFKVSNDGNPDIFFPATYDDNTYMTNQFLSYYINGIEQAVSVLSGMGKDLIIDEPVDLGGSTVDCLGVNLVWLSAGNVISNGTLNIDGCSIIAGRFTIFDTDLTLTGSPELTPVENYELSSKEYTDTKVSLTGDETVDGTKTFSSSPVVPSPSLASHTATKEYVDSQYTTVVVIGDSLSRPSIYSKSWADEFKDKLEDEGYQVILYNLAVGGCTFYKALNDVVIDGKTQVEKAIELNPDILFVGLGINDTIFNRTRSIADIKQDSTDLYNQLNNNLPDTNIIYLSQNPHDIKTLGSQPSSITNKEAIPHSHKLITYNGISSARVNNSAYLDTAINETILTHHQEWGELHDHVSGLFSQVIAIPVWEMARLGSVIDGIHYDEFAQTWFGINVFNYWKDPNYPASALSGNAPELNDFYAFFNTALTDSMQANKAAAFFGIDLVSRMDSWIYPFGNPVFSITPNRVNAGINELTMRATGLSPNASIQVGWDNSYVSVPQTVSKSGDFIHVFQPAKVGFDITPGNHTLGIAFVAPDGSNFIYEQDITLANEIQLSAYNTRLQYLADPVDSTDAVNLRTLKDRYIKSDVTVTVGSTGDYLTINNALEDIVEKYYPVYRQSGIKVEIKLLSGFIMAEQVLVTGLDLSWIKITGEDSITTCNANSLTTPFYVEDNTYAYPAFGVNRGSLPDICQKFDMQSGGTGGQKHGILANLGSSAFVAPGNGFLNCGEVGAYAKSGSTIIARNCFFSGASVGLKAFEGSTIDASGTTANNCYLHGIYAQAASRINAEGTDCSNAGVCGITARRGSTINAEGANCSNAGTHGIMAVNASTINAITAIIQNQTAGPARINVTNASIVEAAAIDTTGGTVPVFSQATNTLTGHGVIYQ